MTTKEEQENKLLEQMHNIALNMMDYYRNGKPVQDCIDLTIFSTLALLDGEGMYYSGAEVKPLIEKDGKFTVYNDIAGNLHHKWSQKFSLGSKED